MLDHLVFYKKIFSYTIAYFVEIEVQIPCEDSHVMCLK